MERIRSKTRLRGPDRRRARSTSSATTTARPRSARSSSIPGAVAIVAHDDLHVYLVRQPREAGRRGRRCSSCRPGKLDVEGEAPLDCAQRELARGDRDARRAVAELKRFYTSPGFADEEVTIFLATDLERVADHAPDPDGADRGRRRGRSRELDCAIDECAGREVADRAAVAAGPAPLAVASLHRQGRRPAGRTWRHGDRRPKAEARSDARFEALVLDFLAYLEFERGLARNTLDAYRTDLLQFGAFLAARGRDAIEVERADVADFLADLATGVPADADGDGGRPPARRRPSTARRPACAPSTATCAARSSSPTTRPRP